MDEGSIPARTHMSYTTYLLFLAVLVLATVWLIRREEE